MLRTLGVAAGAAAVQPLSSQAAPPLPREFQRVVDLTHTLSASFPMTWADSFALEQVSKLEKDKWNANRWHIQEHCGTHLDAPLHCTALDSGDRIPAEHLVGPLVIVDIRARAEADPDTLLTLKDLKAWEDKHGPMPPGAVVAMFTGWDAYVNTPRKFLGLDDKGTYHLPGFGLDAVQFLHEQRQAKGIATDTFSLDPGLSQDFPVHHYWLGKNKWGLENVANLGQLPPKGAMIVVGSPKIAGCTGGPSRVLALV